MTVTPYNFYHMTSLSFKGTIISWDGISGILLDLDKLGRKYSNETICYFDLVLDYMLFLQRTTKEHIRMARAFLLCLLGADLFAMVGKRCPWGGWPSFKTLEMHEGPIRGKHISPIFTFNTFSQGTLRQIVGPWKPLEVSSLPISWIFICSL